MIVIDVNFPHPRLKNLPYSFTKLNQMTAMWLSENQVSHLPHPLTPTHTYSLTHLRTYTDAHTF